jgi:hypothetical protein
MKFFLGSFLLTLSCARNAVSQGTDLGGGVVTRTDVEFLADLSLDVRDMKQVISTDNGGNAALEIYLDGRNSEPTIGNKFKLTQLSTDLVSKGVAKATPHYLFYLFGMAERSTDLSKLAENLSYADNFVRSALLASKENADAAVLVLSIWMYATDIMYNGMDVCQKLVEADNPAQFDLGTAGFDEFIALWIGTGQTHGSNEGNGLYAVAEKADALFKKFGDDDDTGGLGESSVNSRIKSLYQEASAQLSVEGVCTKKHPGSPRKLWSIMTQITSQMAIPLIQQLIRSVMAEDREGTELYALAVVPLAAQCRPSVYKRLRELLLTDNPKFDKAEIIFRDLQDIYTCFGLTCDDIGKPIEQFDGVTFPECFAADARAPMAEYNPTSDVHPVRVCKLAFFCYCCFQSNVSVLISSFTRIPL